MSLKAACRISVTFFFWSVVASVPPSALSTRFSMRCWNLAGSNAWPSVLAKATPPAVAAMLPASRAAIIVVMLLRGVADVVCLHLVLGSGFPVTVIWSQAGFAVPLGGVKFCKDDHDASRPSG